MVQASGSASFESHSSISFDVDSRALFMSSERESEVRARERESGACNRLPCCHLRARHVIRDLLITYRVNAKEGTRVLCWSPDFIDFSSLSVSFVKSRSRVLCYAAGM